MFNKINLSISPTHLLILLLSVFLITLAACDDSDSDVETTEKAPFPAAPTPVAEAAQPAEEADTAEDDGTHKIPGSYRGLHTVDGTTNQGKPVFRWTKNGSAFPDGLVVKWPGGSERISDTSQFQPNYRCSGLHWNPSSRSHTEWGGKLVVMLDCKYAGVKEAWLEY